MGDWDHGEEQNKTSPCSPYKRFVLGGEECAAPFACKTLVSRKTLVAYYADVCPPVDKGEIGHGRYRRARTQIHYGRVQSLLQHSFRTRLSARFASQIRHPSPGLSPHPSRNQSSRTARDQRDCKGQRRLHARPE